MKRVQIISHLISDKDALKIIKALSKKKHSAQNYEFELEELGMTIF